MPNAGSLATNNLHATWKAKPLIQGEITLKFNQNIIFFIYVKWRSSNDFHLFCSMLHFLVDNDFNDEKG